VRRKRIFRRESSDFKDRFDIEGKLCFPWKVRVSDKLVSVCIVVISWIRTAGLKLFKYLSPLNAFI